MPLTREMGAPYMRVFNLVDHVRTDIGNDDLSAGRGVGDCLLCAFNSSFLDLVVLDAFLGRRSRSCRCLSLGRGSSSGVNRSISVLLVLVEVFDKLPHGRDRVVARVMAAGGLLLRRHVVQPWWRVVGWLRRIDPGARCKVQYEGRNRQGRVEPRVKRRDRPTCGQLQSRISFWAVRLLVRCNGAP